MDRERRTTKLSLLNALCEEIAKLVNEGQDKDYHKVEIDGSQLSSGIIFHRLLVYPTNSRSGNFVAANLMLMMK